MTRGQIDEAYQAYQKLCTECELVDMRHAEAVNSACKLQADLEHCERQCSRAWKHYQRCLEVLEAQKI